MRKILLLDTYGTIHSGIEKEVRNAGYQLFGIRDRDELASKTDEDVQLIIVDCDPEKSAADVIADIHEVLCDHIPVIVLSYISEKDAVVKALDAGASDYIVKPYNDSYLMERIERLINPNDYSDVYTEYVSFNMNELLDIELKRAYRGKSSLSLIMLSFHSGEINRSADGILEGILRDIDTVIRYSSNKVLIFLPLTNREGAEYVLERISDTLESYDYLESEMRYLFTSAIVAFPEDGGDRNSLINMLKANLKNNRI